MASVATDLKTSVTPEAKVVTEVEAKLSSEQVVDGSVLAVTVRLPASLADRELSGSFESTRFPFFAVQEAGGVVYEALVGVPHSHATGASAIVVQVLSKGGKVERELNLPFRIVDAGYPSETLTVDPKLVSPPRKELARIQREVKEAAAVYATLAREKRWTGAFVLPIDSPMTSPFGTRRIYNGARTNYHGGLDLRAAVGTPVRAAGSGKVVLAKNLYFTGNTVMIDHGYGLVSLYAHLDRIKVKKGQTVHVRDLIGLSGMTGRVSGPHLHWQVVLNKVKVNPLELMKVMR